MIKVSRRVKQYRYCNGLITVALLYVLAWLCVKSNIWRHRKFPRRNWNWTRTNFTKILVVLEGLYTILEWNKHWQFEDESALNKRWQMYTYAGSSSGNKLCSFFIINKSLNYLLCLMLTGILKCKIALETFDIMNIFVSRMYMVGQYYIIFPNFHRFEFFSTKHQIFIWIWHISWLKG